MRVRPAPCDCCLNGLKPCLAGTAGYYVKGAQLLAAKPDFMCASRCVLTGMTLPGMPSAYGKVKLQHSKKHRLELWMLRLAGNA